MFAKDVLRSIFFGHDVELNDGRIITIFIFICSMLNDGDEVRNVTGRTGAAGNRPDYYTSLHRSFPLKDLYLQPFRHHKVMISQSVSYYIFC